MANQLKSAVTELQKARPPDESAASWADAGTRLISIALPVFNRLVPLERQAATRIRLMTLAMAAAADTLHQRALGEIFRRSAAAITLLEQRYSGEQRPAEVIILRVE